jgi:hypothetical protein
MSTHLESYLQQLRAELGKRGLPAGRVVDEAREHLIDAADHARRRGLSLEDAEQEAIERFGSPELVAETAAGEHARPRNAIWWAVRRLIPAVFRDRPDPIFGGLHDRLSNQGALHFVARAKGRHRRFPDVSEQEARAGLFPMLERAAGELSRFGVSGAIRSLDLLEDRADSGKHSRRYRAVFANGARLIVVHTSDARSRAVDITGE